MIEARGCENDRGSDLFAPFMMMNLAARLMLSSICQREVKAGHEACCPYILQQGF